MITRDEVLNALERNNYVQRYAAKYLNISESHIHRLMNKYKITKKPPASCYISRDTLLYCLRKNNYIKYKTANELSVPITTIDLLIDYYSIVIPNYSFYNILPIDTRLKAYMLGFFICDSGITENEIVELGIIDQEPIHIMAAEMHANEHIEKNGNSYRYRIRKKIPGIISIYNGRLKIDRNIPFNLIPGYLFKYFVLGMFDADGSLCFYMGRGPSNYVEFTAQGNMLPQLYDYMKNVLNINMILKFSQYHNCYRLFTYRREEILSFLSYIYSDYSFIVMPRKYYKSVNFLNALKDREGLFKPVDNNIPIINNIKPFTINIKFPE